MALGIPGDVTGASRQMALAKGPAVSGSGHVAGCTTDASEPRRRRQAACPCFYSRDAVESHSAVTGNLARCHWGVSPIGTGEGGRGGLEAAVERDAAGSVDAVLRRVRRRPEDDRVRYEPAVDKAAASTRSAGPCSSCATSCIARCRGVIASAWRLFRQRRGLALLPLTYAGPSRSRARRCGRGARARCRARRRS